MRIIAVKKWFFKVQTTIAFVQFLCDYTKIDENLIPKTNYVQVIGNQDSGLIIGASRGLMEPP